LLHELAHSLVARSRGLPVNSITLFILGGVSNLEEEPEAPGIEFAMAIVGPGTSLVLALVFWGIASAMSGTLLSYGDIVSGDVLTTPVQAVIAQLGIINLFLGVFNLLPGFPLDGGRVLRSIIWHNTNNLTRATNIAAGVGKLFGWGFIIVGVILIFTVSIISGLWLAFIGWFLNSAADTSRRELVIKEKLGGVRVRDIISPIESIAPSTMVNELVANFFAKKHERAVPVCNGEQIGRAHV
jgi:Zn-dependent protease